MDSSRVVRWHVGLVCVADPTPSGGGLLLRIDMSLHCFEVRGRVATCSEFRAVELSCMCLALLRVSGASHRHVAPLLHCSVYSTCALSLAFSPSRWCRRIDMSLHCFEVRRHVSTR